jgi:hypothetical protein
VSALARRLSPRAERLRSHCAERGYPFPLCLCLQNPDNTNKAELACSEEFRTMELALFDDLERTLKVKGSAAAIDQLCDALRERKDYSSLFYALLLKKRFELGVSPLPTGPAQELPEGVHEPYEEAIRQAGRLVGELYLDQGDIPHAWVYFRMLCEQEPVAKALEKCQPGENDDVQQLVDIAFHQGVHPRRGFDLVLDRFGLCSAITMVSSQVMAMPADIREYSIERLVRALYSELVQRLMADIVQKEGKKPEMESVRELMAGRDWLFADEFYHIDISHLGAVVQMSIYLSAGEELSKARELCEYGQRLSPRFRYATESPFDDQYRDYGIYLATLAGDQVEEGIAHFRAKVEKADPETDGTRPAEVLVNLLLRLDRSEEALTVARRHLAHVDQRQLICPSITELCQRTKDFKALAEVAREQGDPVHFVAGLIASMR